MLAELDAAVLEVPFVGSVLEAGAFGRVGLVFKNRLLGVGAPNPNPSSSPHPNLHRALNRALTLTLTLMLVSMAELTLTVLPVRFRWRQCD